MVVGVVGPVFGLGRRSAASFAEGAQGLPVPSIALDIGEQTPGVSLILDQHIIRTPVPTGRKDALAPKKPGVRLENKPGLSLGLAQGVVFLHELFREGVEDPWLIRRQWEKALRVGSASVVPVGKHGTALLGGRFVPEISCRHDSAVMPEPVEVRESGVGVAVAIVMEHDPLCREPSIRVVPVGSLPLARLARQDIVLKLDVGRPERLGASAALPVVGGPNLARQVSAAFLKSPGEGQPILPALLLTRIEVGRGGEEMLTAVAGGVDHMGDALMGVVILGKVKQGFV